MAFGITTAAGVIPATMSGRSQSERYWDNQSSSGRRKFTPAGFAGSPLREMGPRGNRWPDQFARRTTELGDFPVQRRKACENAPTSWYPSNHATFETGSFS